MNIKCMASDYVIKEKNSMYYVYNEVYEGSIKMIFIAFLIGLLIPNASDYYVPVCVEIKKKQQDIIVKKNLQIIGSDDYRYFIAKHQYVKWKKIYRIFKSIILVLTLFLNICFVLLFLKSNFNIIIGLCMLGVFFLSLGAVIKLEWNNYRRKQYEMIEIIFEK